MGFEVEDVAKLFRTKDRVSEVQEVLEKYSDISKVEQIKIVAFQLKFNTKLFVGSDSLASLESVWSFSKGDGDSEILIGVSGSNNAL